MARADTETLLGLDQYARIIGVDPRHFNQMTCAAFPEENGTHSVWYQEAWMLPGRTSRTEIARNIAEAEFLIAEVMGTWPAPKYVTNERVRWPSPRLTPMAYSPRVWPKLFPKWKGFLAGGQRCTDLHVEDVDISAGFVDPDGDGWNETVSFTEAVVGSSLWNVSEVGIFPADADPIETNRIRDLRVSISGDTITVTGNAAQFIHPELWDNKGFIDGDDPTVFLQFVDIYRVYTKDDPDYPSLLLHWHRVTSTETTTRFGTVADYDPVSASVSAIPVTWSDTDDIWNVDLSGACLGRPDFAMMHYLAGVPLAQNGEVHPTLAFAIAALATARCITPITGGGESIEGIFQTWQTIPEKTTYPQRECPFGSRVGAWQAWQTVRQFLGGYEAYSI